MTTQSWLDAVSKIFELPGHGNKTVKSYRLFERAEFPSSINVFPSALSYPVDMRPFIYSGFQYELWNGETDLFLFPNVDRKNYPLTILYFDRILDAAAANLTLSGAVSHFKIRTEGGPGIVGPTGLTLGGEDPKLGFKIYWEVKVNVTRELKE